MVAKVACLMAQSIIFKYCNLFSVANLGLSSIYVSVSEQEMQIFVLKFVCLLLNQKLYSNNMLCLC